MRSWLVAYEVEDWPAQRSLASFCVLVCVHPATLVFLSNNRADSGETRGRSKCCLGYG